MHLGHFSGWNVMYGFRIIFFPIEKHFQQNNLPQPGLEEYNVNVDQTLLRIKQTYES